MLGFGIFVTTLSKDSTFHINISATIFFSIDPTFFSNLNDFADTYVTDFNASYIGIFKYRQAKDIINGIDFM